MDSVPDHPGEMPLPQQEWAAKDLQKVLARNPAFAKAKIGRALKISVRSHVFELEFHGQKSVLKRFRTDDAPKIVTEAEKNLNELEPSMSSGDCRLNRCLAAVPEDGLLVVEFVPGPALTEILSTDDPARRSALLQHAARWLDCFIGPRREAAPLRGRYWAKYYLDWPRDHLSSEDAMLSYQLHSEVLARAEEISGDMTVRGVVHGDFAARNLHFHDGIMYGVDVQDVRWQIVARDVARFLVWNEMYDTGYHGARWCGLSEPDVRSFLRGGLLSDAEIRVALPFYIGEQLLQRMLWTKTAPERRDMARTAIEHFLAEEAWNPRSLE